MSSCPPRRARPMRMVAALLGVVAVIALLPLAETPAGGQGSELEDARARATEAADAYTAAEVALDEVEVAIARNTEDIAYTQRVYDQVAEAVAAHLVERYIQAGAGAVPLVSDDINVQVRAEALSRLATQRADDQSDQLRRLRSDLEQRQAELDRQRGEAASRKAEMEERRAEMLAELERLEAIEAARQDAERQAEIERRRAAAAAAAAEAAESQASAAAASGSGDGERAPAASRPVVPVDWLCPVTGGYAFSDTWGDARSGGRRHRGTDMFAGYGTPVVAVVDGTAVDYGWDGAGGNGVHLLGDDGNRYYYAHLDDFGSLGRVSQGDVVGYVGDTGNASGTPHLHFEIHPGGSGWTNPYGTLSQYC